ncbi:MAG: flavodoxin family protein [Planctomycetota bacterium]
MRVLTLCGSIRAHTSQYDAVMELAHTEGAVSEFIRKGKSLVRIGITLSNSEILAAATMKGARSKGADIDYFPLVVLFHHKESSVLDLRSKLSKENAVDELAYVDTLSIVEEKLEELYTKIAEADGVILSTPVYFGDRSSVANKFLQVTARKNLLQNKIFGVASVGAKRNGGQETCNIYSMIETLNQGALVVGNGPPTSQYGGTAVGGGQGDVLEDESGIDTAFGVGMKVAHVSEMYSKEKHPTNRIRIDILVTMDTGERFLAKYLKDLTNRVEKTIPRVEFVIHELIDSTIYRCLGCTLCPVPPGDSEKTTKCTIKDHEDCLEKLRVSLRGSDCAIIAGLNLLDYEKIIFRYQVLTERMRYIRRSNFELTDLLITGLCYNQFGATANSIHTIKTLTSYIRHNTTFYKPIDIFEYNGKVLNDGKESLIELCNAAWRMKAGKQEIPGSPPKN